MNRAARLSNIDNLLLSWDAPTKEQRIAALIRETLEKLPARIPLPIMVPDIEGGLTLTWIMAQRTVELKFRASGPVKASILKSGKKPRIFDYLSPVVEDLYSEVVVGLEYA